MRQSPFLSKGVGEGGGGGEELADIEINHLTADKSAVSTILLTPIAFRVFVVVVVSLMAILDRFHGN